MLPRCCQRELSLLSLNAAGNTHIAYNTVATVYSLQAINRVCADQAPMRKSASLSIVMFVEGLSFGKSASSVVDQARKGKKGNPPGGPNPKPIAMSQGRLRILKDARTGWEVMAFGAGRIQHVYKLPLDLHLPAGYPSLQPQSQSLITSHSFEPACFNSPLTFSRFKPLFCFFRKEKKFFFPSQINQINHLPP